MLFDRNPLWTMCSDRIRVRNHVVERVGKGHLVPLLWSGSNPEDIPFDDLPGKFVIKTNHGCGYNILVRDKTKLDQAETKRTLKKWLGENFCQDKYLGIAWGYKQITPMIIVELYLGNNGNIPEDYKFFCFSGRAEYCKVDFDRFDDHSELFFDRERNPIEFYGKGIKHYSGKFELPDNYQEMLRVAESLAWGIDFIRVDLYSVEARIYFGELTCYHGGGMIRIDPREYDYRFGEKWKYGQHGRDRESKNPGCVAMEELAKR